MALAATPRETPGALGRLFWTVFVSGFGLVFAVFASVTIVPYGIMPMTQIAHRRQASMGRLVEHAAGGWSKTSASVGLIGSAPIWLDADGCRIHI